MTNKETFYYKVIPFGLKNVGATFQRMVTKVFKGLTGRNMEAYIDDLVVKSFSFEQHLKDPKNVFAMLKKYKIKLNPIKYVFGIKARKFLGFMISKNGIKLNSERLKALTYMNPPRTLKEVQILMGWIVTLNWW